MVTGLGSADVGLVAGLPGRAFSVGGQLFRQHRPLAAITIHGLAGARPHRFLRVFRAISGGSVGRPHDGSVGPKGCWRGRTYLEFDFLYVSPQGETDQLMAPSNKRFRCSESGAASPAQRVRDLIFGQRD